MRVKETISADEVGDLEGVLPELRQSPDKGGKESDIDDRCGSISPNGSKCTKVAGHSGDHHDKDNYFGAFEVWVNNETRK